ncbi:signal peptide peptidase SppA [Flavobacterium sp. RNTU_13]|uniref:signal peptide peptidase SppA n=1 Tax=Flavobacterium sp. RNTU_13 TaxID=3375145 RepID=UPI003986458C
MQFLKNVLSTIVGLFLFCLLFFFFILIIAAAVGSSSKETVEVKNNSVIELDLSKVSMDYAGKFSSEKFAFFNEEPKNGLINVLKAIDVAKTDSKIKGITITNNTNNLGVAQLKTLRDKIAEFKKSGKFVVSYADTYAQTDYYLNSVADTLYVNPVGEFEFKGLSSELMFFKDFQEKSGITMEVIRHGKYKSAVEPFIANEMSPENREQMSGLLNDLWDSMITDIAASRKISKDSLNSIAQNLSARTPEMAKSRGLVDKIGYEDQYRAGIKKALKVAKDEDYEEISILDYAEANAAADLLKSMENQVAIIYAQGEITNGEGGLNQVGEISIRKAFKTALEDDAVKAIVLRVDSPGGNALTSDLIWREVELAKKKKPVVVSMGNYAASGGYYISCGADRIFAEASTITGSIGVFGVLPNFSKVANNLGVHAQTVSTHDNGAEYSLFQPMQDKTRNVITQSVEQVYGVFVSRVAQGRKLSPEAVDAIGQGRVWSGTDAQRIGLVDEIGGLDAAVKYAAKKANMKDYGTVDYPEYEADFNTFLQNMGNSGVSMFQSRESLIKQEVGEENYRIIERLRRVSQIKGTQAMMPFEINIR